MDHIVLYSGVVLLFMIAIMMKRYWKFMHMLERIYPWIYRDLNVNHILLGRRDREEYLDDSVREIMENGPSQRVREVIEDAQSIDSILFLCFEAIEFGVLFLFLL